MPATIKPLTDTAIRNAKSKATAYVKPDGRGLYLRVAPTGAKTWLFRYERPDTGKQTYASLGAYPEVSLESARSKREEARALLTQGSDPKAHKESQRQAAEQARADALSLGGAISEWMIHKSHTDAPATHEKRESIVRNHILPGLGHRPIRTITRPEIVTHLTKLHAVRPRLVVKVNEYLDDVWEYASNKGHVDVNPTPKIRGLFAKHPPGKELRPHHQPRPIGAGSRAHGLLLWKS